MLRDWRRVPDDISGVRRQSGDERVVQLHKHIRRFNLYFVSRQEGLILRDMLQSTNTWHRLVRLAINDITRSTLTRVEQICIPLEFQRTWLKL